MWSKKQHRFAESYLCGEIVHWKMAACVNKKTTGLFFFFSGPLDVLEVYVKKKEALQYQIRVYSLMPNINFSYS